MLLRDAIARACGRHDLSDEEMAAAMGVVMDGQASEAELSALLVALKMKGESTSEIVGAARAMRARALRLPADALEGLGPVVDTCGTGGDGAATINVSTLAAIVVAACGVRVAKHGNRAVSSRSGSSDLLEALGVDIEAPPEAVLGCLREVGIGYFHAPAWHRATRHAASVRRDIGVRTLFNLLGPLTNPAGAGRQLVGVYDGALVEPLARALGGLGAERALVVHGHGGLDELSPDGPTRVAELHEDGSVEPRVLRPVDFGLPEVSAAGLAGGDAAYNAAAALALLDGATAGRPAGPGGPAGPVTTTRPTLAARNAVLMSAAAALYLAGEANLRQATERAASALDEGLARDTLERLIAWSRRPSSTSAGVGTGPTAATPTATDASLGGGAHAGSGT